MRLRNLASLAAAVVVLFLLTSWVSSLGKGSGIAFAQVQAQVEKTKSVQYVSIQRPVPIQDESVPAPFRNKKAPIVQQRVMALGSLQRTEYEVIEPGDDLPDGARWGTLDEKVITIFDPEKGKMLNLQPERKGYSYVKGFLSINLDDGKVETEELKPSKADFYKQIRDVPRDKAKQLPAKTIDGKSAVGFLVEEKIEHKTGVEAWKRTYWVDEKTKLPIRIEVSMTSTVPRHAGITGVVKDIVFDAPLDAKLFSLDPPAGYKDLAELEQESPKQRLGASGLAKVLVLAEIVAALKEDIEKAKTLKFTMTSSSKRIDSDPPAADQRKSGIPSPPKEHTEVRRVVISGPDLIREEISCVSKQTDEADKKSHGYIHIRNLKQQQDLFLYPDTKSFMAPQDAQKLAVQQEASNDQEKSKGKTAGTGEAASNTPDGPWGNLYSVLQVPNSVAKKLPEQTIDGKKVVGFEVENVTDSKRHGKRTQKLTYWVEPITRQPVRIDRHITGPALALRSAADKKSIDAVSRGMVETVTVFSEIEFDIPVDPTLFSLNPPADYKDLAKLEQESPKQRLGASGLAKALVFAEIVAALQAEIEKAKSLQYTQSTIHKTPEGKRLPTLIRRIMILGDQLKRTEEIGDKPGDDQKEYSRPFGRSIELIDLQKKQKVTLWPETKLYSAIEWLGTFAESYTLSDQENAKLAQRAKEQREAIKKSEAEGKKMKPGEAKRSLYTGNTFVGGKLSLEGAKPLAQTDIFQLILNVPTDKAKQLPEKKIGDKQVVGFQVDQQVTHKDVKVDWHHTWWVDPKTKLPVQLEIRYDTPHAESETTISDIIFDAPLDAALFSTEMPAGYLDLEKARAKSPPVIPDRNQPPTLQFTQVENLKTKNGKQAPEIAKKVKLFANQFRRTEVTLKPGGDEQLAAEKGIRSHVRIDDLKQKKSIVLFPDKKEYLDPTKTTFISDYDALAIQASAGDKPPKRDIYGAWYLQVNNPKLLPVQTVDGKLAIGYVSEKAIERSAGVDTWTRTQWREIFITHDVRIESKFRSTDPSLPDIDWVMSDFVQGEPIDRALFSVEPPEGYRNVGGDSKADETAPKRDGRP